MDALLEEALKAGLSVTEFWAMTPIEVFMAIEGAVWRIKYEAYQYAVLMRMRTLPKWQDIVDPPRTKVLSTEEARELNKVHKKMVSALPERFKQGGDTDG